MNRTSASIILIAVIALVLPSTVAQADLVFDAREKVNIINADDVLITAGQSAGITAIVPGDLRGRQRDPYWDAGSLAPAAPSNYLQYDFKRDRNIKTIQLQQYGTWGITDALVETSETGLAGSWTTASATLTPAAGSQLKTITLDTAVNARFLKITGTQYQDANRRWILFETRAFGDTGATLANDGHLDLVNRSAFGTNPVTLTTVGTVNTTMGLNNFIDDALSPLGDGVLYFMGVGDGVKLNFGRQVSLTKFGFVQAPGYMDSGASYQLEASTDDVTYSPVTSHTGVSTGANYISFGATTAQYLKFTWTASPGNNSDMRISDVFAFGNAVPEPATMSLLALGGLGLLRRRAR